MKRLYCQSVVALTLGLMASSLLAAERWYSSEQVNQGKALYGQNCASCHGPDGASTPNWKTPLENGKYPPPPLNGTGHTWHHSLDVLRRQLRMGGAKVGGWMPAFEGKLSGDQIDAILAYVQSRWSDEIYQAWNQRNQEVVDRRAGNAKPVAAPPRTGRSSVTRLLSQRLGGQALGEPVKTAAPGIYRVKVSGEFVYLTEDGRYAFTGDLVDLQTGRNLTQSLKSDDNRALLDAWPDSDKVVFSAKGEEKAVIDVLTDTSCPFCRKLHESVPRLNAAGVTVRYLPYPRGGSSGPGYDGLRAVWCAADPVDAMHKAKTESPDAPTATDCPRAALVDKGYELGNRLGVQGTPTIFLPTGRKLDGYVPAYRLLPMLGLK